MSTRRTTGSVRTDTAPAAEKAAPRRRGAPVKTEAASAASPTVTMASTAVTISESSRRAMIEKSAYLRAERRGFASGGEVEDWLAAEAEVDALLRAGNGRPPQ